LLVKFAHPDRFTVMRAVHSLKALLIIFVKFAHPDRSTIVRLLQLAKA